jgi:hypothetical protein
LRSVNMVMQYGLNVPTQSLSETQGALHWIAPPPLMLPQSSGPVARVAQNSQLSLHASAHDGPPLPFFFVLRAPSLAGSDFLRQRRGDEGCERARARVPGRRSPTDEFFGRSL